VSREEIRKKVLSLLGEEISKLPSLARRAILGEYNLYRVTVVRVDKNTLKSYRIKVTAIGKNEEDALKMLKKTCFVGDFVIFQSGKKFRRIRGGFRECTEEDEAELIASTL